MKHVRIVIDEVTWYDGMPEELNIQQSDDDTLILKLGPKRRGGSLGDLLGQSSRRAPEPKRVPMGEYVPPLSDEERSGS